jgi:hypothetical protein
MAKNNLKPGMLIEDATANQAHGMKSRLSSKTKASAG